MRNDTLVNGQEKDRSLLLDRSIASFYSFVHGRTAQGGVRPRLNDMVPKSPALPELWMDPQDPNP